MSNDNEVLVRVENVSKIFCRDLKKSLWYGLKDSAHDLLSWGRKIGDSGSQIEDSGSEIADGPCEALSNPQSTIRNPQSEHPLRPGEFYAVRDVSFTLRRGECLGLIGRNGAGKTTLLKMLNGLIKPDAGRIEMHGRIGALIALGSGFNPILTGRENIYVNGSILGLTKAEIDDKIDEIIAFSEIGEFIDAPVQSYSSGMQVRLGFSVATALEPDVLILDEVLAVGDIAFQIKCGRRIRELAGRAAVIFVSHSMQYVSIFCSRVIVMDSGRLLQDTDHPSEGIQTYFSIVPDAEEEAGSLEAKVVSIRAWLPDGIALERNATCDQGVELDLELLIEILAADKMATLRVNILDESLSGIMTFPIVDPKGHEAVFSSGRHRLLISLGKIELNLGKYSFLVAISDFATHNVMLRHQGLHPFHVRASDMNSTAKVARSAGFSKLDVQ
jgi:lipopolysaccharide transport system ATP-binding protein